MLEFRQLLGGSGSLFGMGGTITCLTMVIGIYDIQRDKITNDA